MKRDVDGKPQRLRKITPHVFALDSLNAITLVGGVASEEEHNRMARVVAALEPEKRLVNSLEVDPELRTEVSLSIMETKVDEEDSLL
jgi:hypothetical protein